MSVGFADDKHNNESVFCASIKDAFDNYQGGNDNIAWLEDIWGQSTIKYIIAGVGKLACCVFLSIYAVNNNERKMFVKINCIFFL